ncbi:MAG: PhzF family phenazine biosynthesis protein [Vulcanimicrobiaceae bacterium]
MATPKTYRYLAVDVFTETPFEGNQLAVFPDAAGLNDLQMQTLARELNLSETSFVFPAEDAASVARLRIFTPGIEVPFAGHPTIGTAYALVRLGRIPEGTSSFTLAENVGPIPIRLERRADPFLAWLTTPPVAFGKRFERGPIASALGLGDADLLPERPVQLVSAGNPFLYVPLLDAARVDRAKLDARAIEAILPPGSATGVFVFAPAPDGVYARMFAPMSGVPEDPATGSATGPLGAYLAEYGFIEKREGVRFTNEQGVKMKRRSLIHGILHVRGNELEAVEVGGSAVQVIEASVTIPI